MRRLLLQLLGVSTLLLLALGGLGYAARAALDLDASSEVLLAGDARSQSAYEHLTRLMGDRVPLAVLVRRDDFFSDAGRDALASLCDDLQALPEVNDVKSLTHSRRPVRHGFSLHLEQMLASETFLPEGHRDAASWEELATVVLADPLAQDLFVSRDGRWALALCVAWGLSEPDAVAHYADVVAEVAAAHRGGFEQLHLVGFPYVEREVAADVRRDALGMLVAGALLMALILLLAFRSLLVLLLMGVLGLAGLACLPLLMALAGTGLNLYTVMLVPLVGGFQLTFMAHFVWALQSALRAGAGQALALRRSLRAVALPSLLAGLTTILGLLSLLTCEVGLVREFGTVGAGAVACVLLISLAPPALLSCWRPPGKDQCVLPEQAVSERALAWVACLQRARRPILAAAMLLLLLCAYGASRLRTDLRAVEFLPEDSGARAALTTLDRGFGGLNTFQIEVDAGAPGAAHGRQVLEFLAALRKRGEQLPGVTHVYDLSQVYARLNQLWSGAEEQDVLPSSALQLGLFRTLIQVLDVPLKDLLVDSQGRLATLVVRAPDMPANRWLALLDDLMAFARKRCPPGVSLSLKAGVHELLSADRRLVMSQLASLAVCALAVLITLAWLLRSLREGLAVLACNLLPVLGVLGLMGLAGVALNSITVMIGSLVLGVSVDDAIHILSWRRRLGGDPVPRWASALSAKLRPVLATSAVMSGGFALFLGSSFPPVVAFGGLGALAMLVALAAVLLVLPALLLPPARSGPDE